MDRLHQHRLVAVVGSSGCGKSSLIRAGLIPNLRAGFLVQDRDEWFDAVMTPGDDPLGRLAAACGVDEEDLRDQGASTIVEHFLVQPGASERNSLLLIDQFEELFRFTSPGLRRDDAADFVAVLQNLASQREFPVFVVLTMRSDFLGECDAFHGLPEAFNRSLFLVPRLTRGQRREVIEDPVRLFGRAMTPQLTDRVLNDVGDEPDQLPVMQHVLMRTWERWRAAGAEGPIDLPHYVATGGAKEALSRDADAAMVGMTLDERALTTSLFQALTDTDAGNRRIRRPARLEELVRITAKPRAEVEGILERFRGSGRSFVAITPDGDGDAMVDISHESLIRQWDSLRAWVDQEAESKRIYLDLVDRAARKRGLLRESDLQVAMEWKARTSPTAEWARRYDPRFDDAMKFLDDSRAAEIREADERRLRAEAQTRERLAQERLRRTRRTAAVLGALVFVALAAAAWAVSKTRQATYAQAREREARAIAERLQEAANRKSLDAIAQKDRADSASTEALLAKRKAEQSAAEEKKASQRAELSAAEAQEERRKADLKTLEEASARKLADQKTTEAELAKKAADAERQKAEESAQASKSDKQRADQANRNSQLLLSVAEAREGSRLLANNRSLALGYMGRALRLDPKSLAAQSAIFDLLVRDGRDPREPFRHAPLQHAERVLGAQFTPDGRIVTGFWNGAQVWDPSGGTPPLALNGSGPVNAVAVSSDGRTIVTASIDKSAQVWDAGSGRALGPAMMHNAPVTAAAFSQGGKQLVTGSWDKAARIWDVSTRNSVALEHPSPVVSAAISPDGRHVATACWDNRVRIWGTEARAVRADITVPGQARSVAFSPDGKWVLIASSEGVATVFDWVAARQIGDAMRHGGAVNSAAFSPDGRRVVTASDDNTARVWEAASGIPITAPFNSSTPLA